MPCSCSSVTACSHLTIAQNTIAVKKEDNAYTSPSTALYQKESEKVYEASKMKCESCGNMYEGESCGCGGKKKLLLGGKKSLKEVLSRFNEGKKVDDMVRHVKSSEKKAGHSDKEAENIAWATANKRGMLDNKNKKMEEEAAVEPMLEGGKKKIKK